MKTACLFVCCCLLTTQTNAQLKFTEGVDYNLTESKVPAYTLPDVLQMPNGKKTTTIKQWETIQRPYLYHLFEENVYGRFPATKIHPTYIVQSIDSNALHGTAVRKQITVYFTPTDTSANMAILLYLPKYTKRPAPVFVGLNFSGNQVVSNDTGILLTKNWVYQSKGVIDNKTTDSTRGTQAAQWQVDTLLAHGYGLATVYYGDLEPDKQDGWKTGIRTKLATALQIKPEEWGAIGAWAFGLSQIMDYLITDQSVNSKQVALMGFSRLGKAAMWAGASDQRFAVVISNESGEGGAALSKRFYGETIRIINQKFPHWFAANYKKYNDKTDLLPIDQHELLALMAPRPLYVASAEGDQWSDPKGEFLGARNADPIYKLYGKAGIGTDSMPALHQPVGDYIRYHVRAGKHDVTIYDWQQYIQFADRFFKQ